MSKYYHYHYELDAVHMLIQAHRTSQRLAESTCLSVTKAGKRVERLAAMAEGCSAHKLNDGHFRAVEGDGVHRKFQAHVFYERNGELAFLGGTIDLPFQCPEETIDDIFEFIESKVFLSSIDETSDVEGTVVYAEVDLLLTPLLIQKIHRVKYEAKELIHRPDTHPFVSLFAGESLVQEAEELIGTRRFAERLPTAIKNCDVHTATVAVTAASQSHGMDIIKIYIRGGSGDVELAKRVLSDGAADMAKTVVDQRQDGFIYEVIFEMAYWTDEDNAVGSKLIGAAAYKAVAVVGMDTARGSDWTSIT